MVKIEAFAVEQVPPRITPWLGGTCLLPLSLQMCFVNRPAVDGQV